MSELYDELHYDVPMSDDLLPHHNDSAASVLQEFRQPQHFEEYNDSFRHSRASGAQQPNMNSYSGQHQLDAYHDLQDQNRSDHSFDSSENMFQHPYESDKYFQHIKMNKQEDLSPEYRMDYIPIVDGKRESDSKENSRNHPEQSQVLDYSNSQNVERVASGYTHNACESPESMHAVHHSPGREDRCPKVDGTRTMIRQGKKSSRSSRSLSLPPRMLRLRKGLFDDNLLSMQRERPLCLYEKLRLLNRRGDVTAHEVAEMYR